MNARVFRSEPSVSGLAIVDGRIAMVESDSELRQMIARRTQVLDARWGLVTPGINDAHLHTPSGVIARAGIDLANCQTLEEIASRVRANMPDDPLGWVTGRGWSYRAFNGGFPTRHQLDDIVGPRPASLLPVDGHAAWVSSTALRAGGVTAMTPDPPGGMIIREPGGSEPTGYLLETAAHLVRRAIPRPTPEEFIARFLPVMREMNAVGITSIQDASGGLGDDWREATALYGALEQRGQLTLRARVAFPLHLDRTPIELRHELEELQAIAASTPVNGSRLTFGILKAFADGVVENRTAAMLEPYADERTSGALVAEPAAIDDAILEADRRGWQIEVHAIGDRAVRTILDAYEKAGTGARGRRRHRVEHVESIDSDDIPRFGSLGVIASMQPLHALPDDDLGAVWQLRAGEERSARGWAWESIRRSHGVVVFGSDWPVVTFDPMIAIYVAVTRERPEVGPDGGWIPSEQMSLGDVIRAYTEGPAFAEFADDRRGRVQVGLDADLVVWDRDLEKVDPRGILEARPLFTIFDGRVVHDGG